VNNAYAPQPLRGPLHLAAPTRFRKIPRQQRSIALVRALEEACIQIIRSEGASTVTVSKLSERAGAAVTSIYEYFDSVESIVFNASYNYMLQCLEDDFVKYMQLAQDTSLSAVVKAMVDGIVNRSKFIYESLYEVFRENPQHFTSMSVSSSTFRKPVAGQAISATHAILLKYKDDIDVGNLENAAHFYKIALTSTVNNILYHSPERLYEPDTSAIIAGMIYGALNPRRDFLTN
jgi:AcrR family transcriptional regulator